MPVTLLLALIQNLCDMKDSDAKVVCFDYYVNCSIVTGGNVLSLEDFAKKCKYKE